MKIFCKCITVNISKLHFWLLICITENFIWTNLRLFFQYLDFFAASDSRVSNSCISAKYCPILTNHTSIIYYLFIQLSDDLYISILKNWHLRLVLWSRVTYYITQGHLHKICRLLCAHKTIQFNIGACTLSHLLCHQPVSLRFLSRHSLWI